MSESVFPQASWCRAATLLERVAARRAQGRFARREDPVGSRRLMRWRSQPPFTNAGAFARRLALDGITEDELLEVLGEPLERLQALFQESPRWLVELSKALPRDPRPVAIPFPEGMSEVVSAAMRLVEPLIAHSLLRLRESLAKVLAARRATSVDCATIERLLLVDLPRQLTGMLGRTMVLELNVARLEGRLEGDTPQERFRSFVRRLREPEVTTAIMQEYPVLARQLVVHLGQWVASRLEFLERLCVDWETIKRTFNGDRDPGVLVHVDADAGDRHRSGRSVVIAKFESGFQLVYKPKSLAVDVHFQELLTWVNQRSGHPWFRTLEILDRGAYGWVEFVTAERCGSLDALRRFYERQGAYLALLFVLEATDLHCENLIAVGEHPVLVDLEGLFQPRCITPSEELEEADSTAIDHSVLRVGLLPQRDWSTAESAGVDVSGLGGGPGQITPYHVAEWEKAGTDEMCLTRRRVVMPVAQNRASLNGQDVNPANYTDEILAGFTQTYDLLRQYREELMAPSGPVGRFAEDEVRAILRPTRPYGVLLEESFHPDVLRDALDRDLLFDRLWVATERFPHLAKVIHAELEDLQRGDIPHFTTRPASRDVWSSSAQRIESLFEEPALALVERRVRQLSEQDLQQQRWLLRASLATIAATDGVGDENAIERLREPERAVDHDQLLNAAQSVAGRLESLAIHANLEASWIGLTLEHERHWCVSPLTIDLYDGLPGVTLFLAYLGAITEERRYTELARAACGTLLRRAQRCQSLVTTIGAFDGWGGIIYSLAHLSALWHAPELIAQAEAIVAQLPAWIERDEHFDIISGAAGCIGGLMALHERLPSTRTASAAIACGEHLMAHLQRTQHGVGWIVPKETVPLSGFSHGAAGIAWALLKLTALTGDDRFRRTALAAIAHERSLFSPEAGNWRDVRVWPTGGLRLQEDGATFMTAWCHGAPGIGLARLSTIELYDDGEVRAEIDTALHATLTNGFGRNHSLCHGDLGSLELLLLAGEVLGDGRWSVAAHRLAASIVESVSRHEYRCAAPLNVDSPGLMTGLAGIGYGLLRLADPGRVPSILTLEPPRRVE